MAPAEMIDTAALIILQVVFLCTLIVAVYAEDDKDNDAAADTSYAGFGQAYTQQSGVRSQPVNLDAAAATYGSGYSQQNAVERAQPFDFGYNIQDEFGNTQFRQEKGDESGAVQGSYGYTDAYGVYRKVNYIADASGFRADIKSNEPGLKQDNPADAQFNVESPPQGIQSITATRAGTFVNPGSQGASGKLTSGSVPGRPAQPRPRFPPAARPDGGFQFPQ
ncbi:uncharacterized protein LOC135387738 [Ornithodoros turicata]|uniref:uncharacterized protein LOC135387738 n=1 Tax=Ornithodoros turicata TaxID=34597 RepID=UPI003139AA09